MKKDRIAKGIFLLAALSLLLPWFSFAPDIMGYCRGTVFAPRLALPMIALACCLFSGAAAGWVRPLAVFSAGAALALLLLIPGWWMSAWNMVGGFHWRSGIHGARPCYWLALALYTAQLAAVLLWNRRKRP